MKPVRTGLLAILISIMTLLVSSSPVWAAESFRSYKDWKNDKIQQAQARVDGLKSKPALESQLRNEEFGLQTAKELTVSDYFAGYLIHVSNKRVAFKEAAGKFTPDEVAELMTSYADQVFGSDAGTLPATAHSSADTIK